MTLGLTKARAACGLAFYFVLCVGLPAAAQTRTPTVVVVRDPSSSQVREEWMQVLAATLQTNDARLVPDLHAVVRDHAQETGVIARARVEAWAMVSDLLSRARTAAAGLHEGQALNLLAEAEQIAGAHADVAGAATWLAEVETAIGLVAAQSGLASLSEAALVRAATLDPTRGVRSAEAPPQVLAQATSIAHAVATGPVGSFRVVVDVPDARVLLDEGDVGAAPRVVRATVGTHVLRVEAPGFLPFGQVLQVLPGQRSDVAVSLSRDPLLRVVDALLEHAASQDLTEFHRARTRLTEAGVPTFDVWIVDVGRGPQERALLTVCGDHGCNGPLGLSREHGSLAALDLRAANLHANRAWLLEESPAPPQAAAETPFFRRWYVLAGLGALVAGTIGTTVWATRPTEAPRFEITVDPAGLHR
ncbi:MAG: PEGA domain-containing protein [Sandaracinaceae bacterium]|nr:PEGA domain-containing protein [Sandaracinaceae bacterium]